MCIFAGPVEDVSDTKIFVTANATEQFTAYQMKFSMPSRSSRVDLIVNNAEPTKQAPGNAMILPVPWQEGEPDIRLVDMSKAPKFFTDLMKLQVQMRSRSLSKGTPNSFGADDFLEVHQVGKFSVSIAYNWADISRIDPDVFTLSRDAARTLGLNYSKGFAFVVATLREGGEIHPLGYISQRRPMLFVPTRHEHGEENPQWHHSIYASSDDRSAAQGFVPPASYAHAHYREGKSLSFSTQRVWDDLVAQVPELGAFANIAPIAKFDMGGPLKNEDLILKHV